MVTWTYLAHLLYRFVKLRDRDVVAYCRQISHGKLSGLKGRYQHRKQLAVTAGCSPFRPETWENGERVYLYILVVRVLGVNICRRILMLILVLETSYPGQELRDYSVVSLGDVYGFGMLSPRL
jgi:hypothetical protein